MYPTNLVNKGSSASVERPEGGRDGKVQQLSCHGYGGGM